MRKYLLSFFAFAAIAITLYSCKLDKPILPGDKGYVAAIPPGGIDTTGTGGGTTGGTGSLDTALLSGTWTVKTTGIGEILDGVLSVQTSSLGLFEGVEIQNGKKIGIFNGSTVLITTDTLAYTLSGKNITFSADPVGRSSNGPIKITSLTATTMTWLAPDPIVSTEAGHTIQAAYQFTFTK